MAANEPENVTMQLAPASAASIVAPGYDESVVAGGHMAEALATTRVDADAPVKVAHVPASDIHVPTSEATGTGQPVANVNTWYGGEYPKLSNTLDKSFCENTMVFATMKTE